MRLTLVRLAVVVVVGVMTPTAVCQVKILPDDGSQGGEFGRFVRVDGDVALVGAVGDNAAYVFRFDGVDWVQEQKLLPAIGDPSGNFALELDLAGDVAVVTNSPWCRPFGSALAYVFRWNGDEWVNEQVLLGGSGTCQSLGVSTDGEIIAFGAGGIGPSMVSVYRWDGEVWGFEQQLVASDPESDHVWGATIAVSGNTIVVDGTVAGSQAVFVFHWTGSEWIETQKLLGDGGGGYGGSVSLSGPTLVVGAANDGENGNSSGAAYVYRLQAGVWTLNQKLFASDAAPFRQFGFPVSVSGATIAVGSFDEWPGDEFGAAYLFRFQDDVWVEQTKLDSPDGEPGDRFGWVGLDGDVLWVGADLDDDNGFNSGSAYVFDLSEPLVGDLNDDGHVNGSDLGLLLGSWGPCIGSCLGDLDGDGSVDGADLGILLANWTG